MELLWRKANSVLHRGGVGYGDVEPLDRWSSPAIFDRFAVTLLARTMVSYSILYHGDRNVESSAASDHFIS